MRLVLAFSGFLAAAVRTERVVAAVAPAPPGPAEVPENLCCPISMELMTQPVILADGFTYVRSCFDRSLARAREDDLAYNGRAAGAHASDAEPPREEHDCGVPGV